MKLIDSHCHLQDDRIFNHLPAIIERARLSGVKGFVCCGSSPEDWGLVKKISETYPGVIPAYGLHPWYVDEAPEDWATSLETYLAQRDSIIGETGLDTKFAKSPPDLQEKTLRIHMELAIKLKKPVSIHCVKAWHRLIPILEEYKHSGVPLQLHSYNGGPGMVEQLLKLNCYFSFSGSLTRSRNQKAHQAIMTIPVDRLLIETDAPDIPPEIEGSIDFETPNEPASLKWVITYAAVLLQQEPQVLAHQLLENCRVFLGNPGALAD